MPMHTLAYPPLVDYLPICSLPRQHESRAQNSIGVGLGEGVDGLREPSQSVAAVLESHLANHGAASDAGKVLCGECQECVHNETMRRADADETRWELAGMKTSDSVLSWSELTLGSWRSTG